MSCGLGKDQRPIGEEAHEAGLNAVGHRDADDEEFVLLSSELCWRFGYAK